MGPDLQNKCGKPSQFFIMNSNNRGQFSKLNRFYICERHSLNVLMSRMPIDENFIFPCEEEVQWIR